MQASTGQYSTQAGEPAHPVQLSIMTASIFGFFFLRSGRPCDIGSIFTNVPVISAASVIVTPDQCFECCSLCVVSVNLPQNRRRTKAGRDTSPISRQRTTLSGLV